MKDLDAAYLAGFIDGDGSIHFQLVRQREYKFGYYVRASLALSQSTSAKDGLVELQQLIGCGYLRDRGTGMSDLVITSRPALIWLLTAIQPYVVFKREHVDRALLLLRKIRPRPNAHEFLEWAREVDSFATLNYSKSKRIGAEDVERHLRKYGFSGPRNDFFGFALRRDASSCLNDQANPCDA